MKSLYIITGKVLILVASILEKIGEAGLCSFKYTSG